MEESMEKNASSESRYRIRVANRQRRLIVGLILVTQVLGINALFLTDVSVGASPQASFQSCPPTFTVLDHGSNWVQPEGPSYQVVNDGTSHNINVAPFSAGISGILGNPIGMPGGATVDTPRQIEVLANKALLKLFGTSYLAGISAPSAKVTISSKKSKDLSEFTDRIIDTSPSGAQAPAKTFPGGLAPSSQRQVNFQYHVTNDWVVAQVTYRLALNPQISGGCQDQQNGTTYFQTVLIQKPVTASFEADLTPSFQAQISQNCKLPQKAHELPIIGGAYYYRERQHSTAGGDVSSLISLEVNTSQAYQHEVGEALSATVSGGGSIPFAGSVKASITASIHSSQVWNSGRSVTVTQQRQTNVKWPSGVDRELDLVIPNETLSWYIFNPTWSFDQRCGYAPAGLAQATVYTQENLNAAYLEPEPVSTALTGLNIHFGELSLPPGISVPNAR
jgi:hypothetical protein